MEPRIITPEQLLVELGGPSDDPQARLRLSEEEAEAIIERVMRGYADEALARVQVQKADAEVAHVAQRVTIEVESAPEDPTASGAIPGEYLPFVYDRAQGYVDGRWKKLTPDDDIHWTAETSAFPRYRYQVAGRRIEVLPASLRKVRAYLVEWTDAIETVLRAQVSDINKEIIAAARQAVESGAEVRADISRTTPSVP